MFESGGIFYHAVAVHAAFVHECGFADVGRVFGQTDVCDFRNAPRRVGKFLMESSGRISYPFLSCKSSIAVTRLQFPHLSPNPRKVP